MIASVAPLVAAGVIWAITGSAFTLVFAVLGPVIAVATMIDGRRTSRAKLRQDTATYLEAVDAVRTAVTRRHEAMRRAAWAHTPAASMILDSSDEGGRWQQSTATGVTLGSGTVFGEPRLEGPGDTAENRDLRQMAAALTEAPLAVDPRGGIGIAGPLALSRALARGLLVQLCFAIPPGRCAPPQVPAAGWEWAAALPHTDARSPSQAIAISEGTGFDASAASDPDRIRIALAATIGELPPGCDTIVRVHGPARAELVRSTAHAWATEFRPELVSVEDAARFARRLHAAALAIGLVGQQRVVPGSAALAELRGSRAPSPAGPTTSLETSIGVGERGDVSLDLVAAGPHAVVGGTTGSGKSELLVTWVASLASKYSPAQVTFLLVDFKGGAAFGPLTALPHCVGLITDLDQGEAARALRSLAAELRYREEVLRGAGARDIGQIDPAVTLPRLVIVVDEFATMLDAFPELHARFVDIAARGRSLGVHLILCTQRPAGVVRDALLANCSLRLSLRVNNRADSIAVIGTDAAARLAPDQPGRCLIETPGGGTRLCQVATTTEGDIRAIADAVPAGPAPRRPWLDRLPAVVTLRELRAAASADDDLRRPGGGGGYLLGLLDEPERQRYRVAGFLPARDGNLLVVGGAGSGKSSLLAALAAQESAGAATVEVIAPDVEAAWDALESAHGALGAVRGGDARLLLFDDLDSVWARWEPEYRVAAAELLAGVLRDGRATGLHLVITVQRISGALQALPGLCQSVLWLRLPSRSEHAAAAGDNAPFDPTLPPGGGTWQGSRIQLPLPEPGRAGESPTGVAAPSILDGRAPRSALVVVSGSPARSATALRTALAGQLAVVEIAARPRDTNASPELHGDGGDAVFVGDADSWQAQWGLFSALRPGAGIVFDGCSLGEFRMISRRREIPPPLAPGRGHVWMLRADGTIIRASLPAAFPRG